MSHRNRDEKNRWRNKTIAFRVSPEENDLINARVVASGLTKQEFLTSNMLNARITVRGSSRVYYGGIWRTEAHCNREEGGQGTHQPGEVHLKDNC